MAGDAAGARKAGGVNRWGQLAAGLVCMTMIANLQYGWTLFVNPIAQKFHWDVAAIQVAFSIFVATETWLVPIEGWFVDRFGPRVMVALGGVTMLTGNALSTSERIATALFLVLFIIGLLTRVARGRAW